MRKRLLLLCGVVLAVLLGAGGTTLALFSSSSGTTSQQITAGTVAILGYRDMGDTIPGPMFYTTRAEGQTPGGLLGRRPTGFWAPGDTFTRALFVENRGSLNAYLTGVSATMHAGTSRHLAERLQVTVTTDLAGSDTLASGTLAAFIDAPQAFARRIAVAADSALPPLTLYFHVTLPRDADNSYSGEQLQVDFQVSAEQQAHNP